MALRKVLLVLLTLVATHALANAHDLESQDNIDSLIPELKQPNNQTPVADIVFEKLEGINLDELKSGQVFPVACGWTGFVNQWDGVLNFRCPYPSTMNGAYSVHNNHREDRIWRFQCCTLQVRP